MLIPFLQAVLEWRGTSTALLLLLGFFASFSSIKGISHLARVACGLLGFSVLVLMSRWIFQDTLHAALSFTVLVLLFTWAMDGAERVPAIAIFVFALMLPLGMVHWAVQQWWNSKGLMNLLMFLAWPCSLLAFTLDALTGWRRQPHTAPSSEAAPTADEDDNSGPDRATRIHATLDSDEAQEAADKYTRE